MYTRGHTCDILDNLEKLPHVSKLQINYRNVTRGHTCDILDSLEKLPHVSKLQINYRNVTRGHTCDILDSLEKLPHVSKLQINCFTIYCRLFNVFIRWISTICFIWFWNCSDSGIFSFSFYDTFHLLYQVPFPFHVKNLVIMPNSHISICPGVKRSNGQFTVDCPSI
jgi:hypothetical protein